VKVLIVEDEWLIAEDLKLSLEELGLEVLGPALNCAAALEIIWRHKPDLAFVDTQLGSETCEAVLEECERQAVPVVISSGHAAGLLPDYCKDFPLLGKPYDGTQIAKVVSQHAARQGA
jgi:DNA-binding response OmpR family regulator